MEFLEVDDDSPHKPPPERALWCAVLATFDEDIGIFKSKLNNKRLPKYERKIQLALLDATIDDLVSPWCETICELANVVHTDFVDELLKRVEGVK